MKKLNKHYIGLAVAILAYAALTLLTPTEQSVLSRYGVTNGQAALIKMTVVIPSVLIWLGAFYGLVRIKDYAFHIRDTKDGKAFSLIARGLTWLVYGLPVTAVVNSTANYLRIQDPGMKPMLTIINNYVSIAVVLIGFYIIYKGTRQLVDMLQYKIYSERHALLLAGFALFSTAFTYVTLTNPYREAASPITNRAAYYLSDPLLILTIIIPYVALWYFGFSAAYHIFEYQKRVQGVLYKQAIKWLALGLGAVVISSMAVRYFVSLTTLVNSLNLRLLLVVVYVLLFVISAGYILIAMGAKKLKLLEEA
ncbi:MAG: hypothetical protein JWL85_918 [Candidatus Saccharibacteria bacterium]|nr:hypothetical protein [Candidatus Saccharibacteria bacterium]